LSPYALWTLLTWSISHRVQVLGILGTLVKSARRTSL
jgi:hypothetical protein